MARQSERRAETRSRIVRAAREAFLTGGFEEASLDSILAAAALSKGALYHHFSSKEAVFAAVYEDVTRETIARARPRSVRDDPVAALVAAAVAWLNAVEAPEPRAILLEQGPRVLGFARARAIEDPIALASMEALVKAAAQSTAVDISLAARLINATLTELALLRHASNGRSPSAKAMKWAVGRVVHGLLRG